MIIKSPFFWGILSLPLIIMGIGYLGDTSPFAAVFLSFVGFGVIGVLAMFGIWKFMFQEANKTVDKMFTEFNEFDKQLDNHHFKNKERR